TIACALHWFNPLAWLAARRLRLERELAADEAVLRSGIRASTYAADLLAIAGEAPVGTGAIGEKPIASRIAAILAEERPVTLGTKRTSALLFTTAAVAVVVGCRTTAESASLLTVVSHGLDGELQSIAGAELERTVAEWKASGGTILVMSPKGDVLAEVGG